MKGRKSFFPRGASPSPPPAGRDECPSSRGGDMIGMCLRDGGVHPLSFCCERLFPLFPRSAQRMRRPPSQWGRPRSLSLSAPPSPPHLAERGFLLFLLIGLFPTQRATALLLNFRSTTTARLLFLMKPVSPPFSRCPAISRCWSNN